MGGMGQAVQSLARAVILALLLVEPAAAASFVVPGPVCTNYALVRAGNDMILTCPLYSWAPTAPPRRTWATVKNWYGLCLYHGIQRSTTGDAIVCLLPAKKR